MKKFGRVLKKSETINGGKKINMGKIFKKLDLSSDDLPQNIGSVFSEDGNFTLNYF